MIKCPKCGAILRVEAKAGLEGVSITCPVCGVKSPYLEYKPYIPKTPTPSQGEETQYGGNGSGSGDDETRYDSSADSTSFAQTLQPCKIGKLVSVSTGRTYALSVGINSIGRHASTSPATVQIVTDDRHMSRNHANIEVKKFSDGTVVHYLSNSVNKNPTTVNGRLLEPGDRIILQSGDLILMGMTNVRFEME